MYVLAKEQEIIRKYDIKYFGKVITKKIITTYRLKAD
jgi:hypothetical protein